MAKTAKKHREHRSVPHNKIAKMWYEGKSYLQIGKAIDRLAPNGDVTKPVRAIISRMLNQGWADENGKIVVLKPREGMRAIGVGLNAPKSKTTVKPAKVAKAAKVNSKGPAVLIALAGQGKFVRMEVGKSKALPKTELILPSLIAIVEKSGYTVSQNASEPVEPEKTAEPGTETPNPASTDSAPQTETAPDSPATDTPITEVPPTTGTEEQPAAA